MDNNIVYFFYKYFIISIFVSDFSDLMYNIYFRLDTTLLGVEYLTFDILLNAKSEKKNK